jgi:hypothetical protein
MSFATLNPAKGEDCVIPELVSLSETVANCRYVCSVWTRTAMSSKRNCICSITLTRISEVPGPCREMRLERVSIPSPDRRPRQWRTTGCCVAGMIWLSAFRYSSILSPTLKTVVILSRLREATSVGEYLVRCTTVV